MAGVDRCSGERADAGARPPYQPHARADPADQPRRILEDSERPSRPRRFRSTVSGRNVRHAGEFASDECLLSSAVPRSGNPNFYDRAELAISSAVRVHRSAAPMETPPPKPCDPTISKLCRSQATLPLLRRLACSWMLRVKGSSSPIPCCRAPKIRTRPEHHFLADSGLSEATRLHRIAPGVAEREFRFLADLDGHQLETSGPCHL